MVKTTISYNDLRIKEVAEGNLGKMKCCLLSAVRQSRFNMFLTNHSFNPPNYEYGYYTDENQKGVIRNSAL